MSLRQTLCDSLKSKSHSTDFWLQASVFLFLGILFWPITQWLAESAQSQSRLLHALIVLVLACSLLIKFSGIRIEEPFTLNRSSRTAVYLTFGLLLLQQVVQWLHPANYWSLIAIPAYVAGLASLLLFIFGQAAKRIIVTCSGTLGLFIFLSTLMDFADWPLRALAGQWSGWILGHMGQSVQLGIHEGANAPAKLILLVNQHPFHVASECNGFGAIMTCLLVACLLSLYKKLHPVRFIANLIAGIALGLAFNILRIVCIVLLAPQAP